MLVLSLIPFSFLLYFGKIRTYYKYQSIAYMCFYFYWAGLGVLVFVSDDMIFNARDKLVCFIFGRELLTKAESDRIELSIKFVLKTVIKPRVHYMRYMILHKCPIAIELFSI